MITDVGELAGAAEIGRMLGVSRQRVQQLINHPDFPTPRQELVMGKVWNTADIRAWAEQRGRAVSEDEEQA